MANLVFQTAYPGDLFLCLPLIQRLRAWQPEARLVLACRPHLGEYFLKAGLVDEVIEIDKKSRRGRASARQRLRSEIWDFIFVPHQSVRTALWMWGLRGQKVAFRSWWNWPFYQHRVQRPEEFPDALRQLSLLAAVDSATAELYATDDLARLKSPHEQGLCDFREVLIPEWASMQVLPHRSDGRTVFLAPGSMWGTKRWHARGYQELARKLKKRNLEVVLVGSREERPLCAEIAASVPDVINRAGETSLKELVEELARGIAIVCNDSGAMHAAACSGLPTVAIFGPTTLDVGFRPWNPNAIVVQKPLPCRPCGKHGPKVCPLGTHECMESITADDVLKALKNWL